MQKSKVKSQNGEKSERVKVKKRKVKEVESQV